jgi:hypothetical protein
MTMTNKKALLTVSLSLLLVLVVAGAAFAQGTNPPTGAKGALADKAARLAGLRGALPFGGWKIYDAIAGALKLSPSQLFEQLHGGKTVKQVAETQGVQMQAVQDAMKNVRQAQARDAIQKALDNGKITKERADWMLQGLEKGWRIPRLPLALRLGKAAK